MKIQIKTPRLLLREVEDRDAGFFIKAFNDPEVIKYLGKNPFPFTQEDARDWISCCKKFAPSNTRIGYEFTIEYKHEPVGTISLSGATIYDARLGFFLLREYWRKGIMSEAIDSIIKAFLIKWDCNCLYSEVDRRNIVPYRLLEKKGFSRLEKGSELWEIQEEVGRSSSKEGITDGFNPEKDFLYALYKNQVK